MSEHENSTPDVEELRERVADLRDAAAALREYGEENDVPAVERNAKRVEGTVNVLEQHVPPATDDNEGENGNVDGNDNADESENGNADESENGNVDESENADADTEAE